MKKLIALLFIIACVSCNKPKDEPISQTTEISGRACDGQNLEQVLIVGADAPDYQPQVGGLALKNVDASSISYNTFYCNNNSVTIHCNATGRELTIDFNDSIPHFTIVP